MAQITHRVLRFDRFTLDLTSGCLRAGDQEIALRPKAFEVLRYLAENAERLVAKQELYEAVWPNVIVSDDSIAQCIWELRHKLGDTDHNLIKTVSRRGFLLNAAVSVEGARRQSGGSGVMPPEEPQTGFDVLQRVKLVGDRKKLSWLGVAAGLLLVAWLTVHLLGRPALVASPPHVRLGELAPHRPLPSSFKDCPDCPEMVALPAGEFMMGSPPDERGREAMEGLPRRVVIPKRFAIGKFEVTVDQFSTFVAETRMTPGNSCNAIAVFDRTTSIWGPPEASFRDPGFDVIGSQPVVCISWHEAQSYTAWLERRTGKLYRLPTEAEWEYAARAGTTTRYSFGDDETELCAYAKFADLGSRFGWRDACRSNTVVYGPLPVGSLKPNAWGLFDMHGNAWEWVEDCWTPNARKIPVDGSAFAHPGDCETGIVRGGSFAAGSGRLRAAMRAPLPTATHHYNDGFRVALSLDD